MSQASSQLRPAADEDAHQLRDHQGGVGVVDLDDVLLVEVLQGAVGLDMPARDGLQGWQTRRNTAASAAGTCPS